MAVEGGHVDTVRFLVDQGPDDINSKDINGVSIYRYIGTACWIEPELAPFPGNL